MKILNEKEILKKCSILNKKIVNINENNLDFFFKNNTQFNYKLLEKKALNELKKLGYNIENCQNETLKKVPSVESYIKSFSTIKRNIYISDGSKANLSFYIGKQEILSNINKGQFIGSLSNEKIKENITYICLEDCDISLIDKTNTDMSRLYPLIKNKKVKIFQEIINNFYIFHSMERYKNTNSFDDIAPKIVHKKYYKGDKIFMQGSEYKGIYFIKSGKVKINLKSSINEMINLTANMKSILNSFNDYAPSFRNELINDQEENFKKQINALIQEMEEIKKYDIMDISENNIFGSNELFDFKTGIYNFYAECLSKNAIIYFLPKEHVNELLGKDKDIYSAFVQLVEFRVKDITWKIKNYIKIFHILRMKHQKHIERFLNSQTKINNNKTLSSEIVGVSDGNIIPYNKTFFIFDKSNKKINKNLVLKESCRFNKRLDYFLSNRNNSENQKKAKLISNFKINSYSLKTQIKDKTNEYKLTQSGYNIGNGIINKFPYCVTSTQNITDNHKNNSKSHKKIQSLDIFKIHKKRNILLSSMNKNKNFVNISYMG